MYCLIGIGVLFAEEGPVCVPKCSLIFICSLFNKEWNFVTNFVLHDYRPYLYTIALQKRDFKYYI